MSTIPSGGCVRYPTRSAGPHPFRGERLAHGRGISVGGSWMCLCGCDYLDRSDPRGSSRMTRRPNTLASTEYAPGPSRPSAVQPNARAIIVSALSPLVRNTMARTAAASTNARIRVPNPSVRASAKVAETTMEALSENCGDGRRAITRKTIHEQANLSSTSATPAAPSG